MKAIGLVLLVTLLHLTTANQVDCPPWFFPDADGACQCSKVYTDGFVKCVNDRALLQIGVCMTYDNETKSTEVGPCPYMYISHHFNFSKSNMYLYLPNQTSKLNNFTCGSLNRKGLLCGECEPTFGPALYSYTLECKQCWGHGLGWLLYITLTIIPTTVLYIIVVIFHVSATSPPLNVFVLFCHITVYTFRSQPDLYVFAEDESKRFSRGFLKGMLALCGLWNLDFFRPLVPPFCVSPNLTNLHAFALEYIEAFYPLILILITYICIKLHDHNFRPVVLLWKPFHRCFVYFRRSWDPEASVINAFATFFLLSFSKLLFVSFTLMYRIKAKFMNRNGTWSGSSHVLYYDSTVEYFSKDHSPFAAFSICVGLVFTVFPTLLLVLYPTRIFRKCITCCRFRRWHALHTFMEAFQGKYKDGTNGTRDFRMVSALYLILRIAVLLSYLNNRQICWLIASVILFGESLFFSILRPYKVNHLNTIDCLLLGMLSILAQMGLFVWYLPNQKYRHMIGLTGLLIMGIPHAALVLYILYITSKKIRIFQHLKRKCQYLLTIICCNKQSQPEANNSHGGLDVDSFPDRLVNPDEYEPLFPVIIQQGSIQTESCAVQARVTSMNTYGVAGD